MQSASKHLPSSERQRRLAGASANSTREAIPEAIAKPLHWAAVPLPRKAPRKQARQPAADHATDSAKATAAFQRGGQDCTHAADPLLCPCEWPRAACGRLSAAVAELAGLENIIGLKEASGKLFPGKLSQKPGDDPGHRITRQLPARSPAAQRPCCSTALVSAARTTAPGPRSWWAAMPFSGNRILPIPGPGQRLAPTAAQETAAR